MDSKAVLARCTDPGKALVMIMEQDEKISGLEKELSIVKKENADVKKENAELQARLALYESPNMPTSTPSLYNDARKKFREKRGEDPGGSPGDAARGKKRGPPCGHHGTSHGNRPSMTLRYDLDFKICPKCNIQLRMLKPIHKLVNDLDGFMRMLTANAIIQNAVCPQCNTVHVAATPFLSGTSLGPVSLSLIMMFFEKGNIDEDIAEYFQYMFGFKMAPNTVTAARHAVAEAIQQDMIQRIQSFIAGRPWIQMDETGFKRGDGHMGYVWVLNCEGACFVVFADSRSSEVLHTHFGWLDPKTPIVVDGLAQYKMFFEIIQRCWRHLLAYAEKLAVRMPEGDNEKRYDLLLEFYRKIDKIKTLAPLTYMELSREAYKIISPYEDDHVCAHMQNAMPNMFTCLAHRGMPLHNNDTERCIRDGIIPQRNARHKIVTDGGRKTASALLTFSMTCRKQNIHPAGGLLEYLRNPDWNVFAEAGDDDDMRLSSLVNTDGTRYSVFECPGPPPVWRPVADDDAGSSRGAVRRDRTAVVPAVAAPTTT